MFNFYMTTCFIRFNIQLILTFVYSIYTKLLRQEEAATSLKYFPENSKYLIYYPKLVNYYIFCKMNYKHTSVFTFLARKNGSSGSSHVVVGLIILIVN